MGDTYAASPPPEAVYRLVPELRTLPLQGEARSDCARCVMLPVHSGESPEHPWAYNPRTKCCTFQPSFPNFLAGNVLRRKDRGARQMLERMGNPEGLTSWGISPPAAWSEKYRREVHKVFGHDDSMRCPYWVGGTHSCGVWKDRPPVCRTWSCKHEHGRAGKDAWDALENALADANDKLAYWCIFQGRPPSTRSGPRDWARWYTWCAKAVDRMTDDQVDRLADARLADLRSAYRAAWEGRAPELPEVVMSSIAAKYDEAGTTMIVGYSTYDGARLPRSIFVFLSKLDGRRPWREALDLARADGADVDEARVRELFRVGAIRSPRDGDIRDPDAGSHPLLRVRGDGRFAGLDQTEKMDLVDFDLIVEKDPD